MGHTKETRKKSDRKRSEAPPRSRSTSRSPSPDGKEEARLDQLDEDFPGRSLAQGLQERLGDQHDQEGVANAVQIAQRIDRLYSGRLKAICKTERDARYTYRRVRHSSEWRTLFGIRRREMPYVDVGKTDEETTRPTESFRCWSCGFIFPTSAMQIDHHVPQKGDDCDAINKVLRALGLGLTEQPGKGGVSRAVQANDFVHEVPRSKDKRGKRWTGGSEDDGRDRRSDEGRRFVGLVEDAKMYDRLVDECRHSMVNLRPMCPSCNASKQDRGRHATQAKKRKKGRKGRR